MFITSRRVLSSLAAAAVLATLASAPSLAQMSTTAPSNSEGTPSAGTGVIGQSQASPAPYATPQRSARRSARAARRARARAARRAARRNAASASSGN